MSTCALLNEIFMLVPLIPSACVLRLYILVISSSVARRNKARKSEGGDEAAEDEE